jgi:hypothetical protein
MPDKSKYSLEFRPRSYGEPTNSTQILIAKIKGEMRKRMVRIFLSKDGSDVKEWITKDKSITKEKLSDAERKWIGGIHPLHMGGEYLPDYEHNEIEIARVFLKSTTGDVFSLRARQQGRLIQYRIVDEYGTEFKIQPEETIEPLSMGELIRLIDDAENEGRKGLTNIFRDFNLDKDPMELLDFVTVTSEFYPDLQRWYRDEAKEWCDKVRRRITQA